MEGNVESGFNDLDGEPKRRADTDDNKPVLGGGDCLGVDGSLDKNLDAF